MLEKEHSFLLRKIFDIADFENFVQEQINIKE